MVVKKAAATAGAGAGGFLGGLFNNPGVLVLGVVAILLLFFQKDIRQAFGSLGEGISEGIGGLGDIDINLPEFNFPDISFPDITFPSFDFPDITFPSFDFGDPFAGVADFFAPKVEEERMDVPFGDTDQIIDIVPDVTGGRADRLRDVIDPVIPERDPALDLEPSDAELFARDFPEPFVPISPTPEPQPITPSILPEPISPITGTGGPSFEGGTIFENPLDTLSEVIDLFPGITASQAADFLNENFGISPSAALAIGPDVINIAGDPGQEITILPASSEELSGLSPEAIFEMLFGNVQNPNF